MSAAYVDTSSLITIAFNEPGAKHLVTELSRYQVLLSSNLLEAEVRSAFARVGSTGYQTLLAPVELIFAERSLSAEIDRVLANGYLRGADLHHLATALLLASEPIDLVFVTMDRRQLEVAREVGLETATALEEV